MRKVTVVSVSLVVALALSLMVAGTILAQGGDETETTAWLGVRLGETEGGVFVVQVITGSPAAADGLLIGDQIISLDGATVESAQALAEAIQAHGAGDIVTLVVMRNGTERTLEVELGSTPQFQGGGRWGRFSTAEMDTVTLVAHLLGVNLEEADGGYEVTVIGRLNPADLQEGDVITAVNGQAIATVDWNALWTELAQSDNATLTLTVLRDGEEITVESALFARLHGGGRGQWPMGGFEAPDLDAPGRFGRGGFRGDLPQQAAPGGMQSNPGGVSVPATEDTSAA